MMHKAIAVSRGCVILVVLSVLLPLIAVMSAPPALANTAPAWSKPVPFVWPGRILTAPDGTVAATSNAYNTPIGFQTYSRAGTAGWQLSSQDLDYAYSSFDASGNLYLMDGPAAIASYGRYGQRWRHTVAGEILGNSLVVTPTSVYYKERVISSGGGISMYLAARGLADGALVSRTSVPNNCCRMFAYDGGLVATGDSKVEFFDFDGASVGSYAVPAGMRSIDAYTAITATGELYELALPAGTSCLFTAGAAEVYRYTASGGRQTVHTFPSASHCSPNNFHVTATGDGGVLVAIGADGEEYSGLSHFDADNDVWYADMPAAAYGTLDGSLTIAAGTGGILVGQGTRFTCANWSMCFGIQVDLLDTSTGDVVGETRTIRDSDDAYGMLGLAVDFTGERFYVASRFVPDANYGLPSEFYLHAFDDADIGQSYPESLLFGDDLVTRVETTVDHDTPLWELEVTASFARLSCPADVSISIGGQVHEQALCATGGTPPASITYNQPVFGSGWALEVDALEDVSASVKRAGSEVSHYYGAVTTPPAPVWVAVGDSYSSGHHQDGDYPYCIPLLSTSIHGGVCPNGGAQGAAVHKKDGAFAWPTHTVNKLNDQLDVPSAWAMQAVIPAESGAPAWAYGAIGETPGTEDWMSAGQASVMKFELDAHPGSWNVVSLTGGANDIEFVEAMATFYEDHPFGTTKPWDVQQRSDCVNTEPLWQKLQVAGTTTAGSKGNILLHLQGVVDAAESLSTAVRIVAMHYPEVVRTDNVCWGDEPGSHGAGAVVDELSSVLESLTGVEVHQVDLRTEFGSNPLPYLQLKRLYGYPHPELNGQELAAEAAFDALTAG